MRYSKFLTEVFPDGDFHSIIGEASEIILTFPGIRSRIFNKTMLRIMRCRFREELSSPPNLPEAVLNMMLIPSPAGDRFVHNAIRKQVTLEKECTTTDKYGFDIGSNALATLFTFRLVNPMVFA